MTDLPIRLPDGSVLRESGGPRLVDVDAEDQGDLLRNPFAAPGAIAPFHGNHRVDQFFRWSFGTRTTGSFGREQQPALLLYQELMKMQPCRSLQDDRRL